jgi:hypothetical protein
MHSSRFFNTITMKLLIVALLFFASCSPQQKMSKVTGGYTDEGVAITDRTITNTFTNTRKKVKTKRHPAKYYVKSKPFFSRAGINGELNLYNYK